MRHALNVATGNQWWLHSLFSRGNQPGVCMYEAHGVTKSRKLDRVIGRRVG